MVHTFKRRYAFEL